MRRFSQRNSLVTLNDINITPLLDLAFVLLIIFIITTPLLEQGLDLNLPDGGVRDKNTDRLTIKTIDISPQGKYVYSSKPTSLDLMEKSLAADKRMNSNVVVYIRCDQSAPTKYLTAVLNRLETVGIKNVSIRTSPNDK